jgi:hypothetical protein
MMIENFIFLATILIDNLAKVHSKFFQLINDFFCVCYVPVFFFFKLINNGENNKNKTRVEKVENSIEFEILMKDLLCLKDTLKHKWCFKDFFFLEWFAHR